MRAAHETSLRMPFVDPNNVSENPYAEEVHFAESGSAALTGANENLIYDYPDWEDPELAAAAQGGSPPVTVLNQTGGYATIRLNRDLYYSGSIWFQGQVSGTIARGSTFTGRDQNGNGIPDLFERLMREGKIHFEI
jgi:hypothetical protein